MLLIKNKTYPNCSCNARLKCLLLYVFLLDHQSTKCSVGFCDSSMSGVRACLRATKISLNNISSETAYWILTKLHRNNPSTSSLEPLMAI